MIEIYDNREKGCNVKYLENGTVFESQGLYCMRIEEGIANNAKFNAVDLQTGELKYFDYYSNAVECRNVRLEIDDD